MSSSEKGFSLRDLTRRWTAGKESRRAAPIVLRERYATPRQEGARWSPGASRTIEGDLPQWATEEESSRPEAWAGLPLLLPLSSGGRSRRRIRGTWTKLRARDGGKLRPSLLVAILLVLGAFALVRGGSSPAGAVTLSAGALAVATEGRSTLPLWVGASAIMAGLVVIAAGMWKEA